MKILDLTWTNPSSSMMIKKFCRPDNRTQPYNTFIDAQIEDFGLTYTDFGVNCAKKVL